MRVSEYYNLGITQSSLDFVDIDVVKDTKVFVDPSAINLLPSAWGNECVSLIQDFFQVILDDIKNNKIEEARKLLILLHEPNETHLGVSRDKSRGKALGKILANDVLDSLQTSQAVKSGLLEDLEDTILMIEGVGPDIISDITTNIIRGPLIRYTEEVCATFAIKTEEVASGPVWNSSLKKWGDGLVKLPVYDHKKLLLVPKIIVRKHIDYNPDEYYQHYLLEHLKGVELNANSALVELLKNGNSRVTKKALKKKYGSGKSVIVDLTRQYPEVLETYRKEKKKNLSKPLSLEEVSDSTNSPNADWDELLRNVLINRPGGDDAYKYESAIELLLTALMYPGLSYPKTQRNIHDGRKRIDIEYTNILIGTGFFSWLGQHYTAPHVFIECKNYSGDIGNPELDQLAGRFGPSRGQFGILVCRSFDNKKRFIQTCIDTAKDQRGYIIVLDDKDLGELVSIYKTGDDNKKFSFFKTKFDRLIM